jgi:hypothetical protein
LHRKLASNFIWWQFKIQSTLFTTCEFKQSFNTNDIKLKILSIYWGWYFLALLITHCLLTANPVTSAKIVLRQITYYSTSPSHFFSHWLTAFCFLFIFMFILSFQPTLTNIQNLIMNFEFEFYYRTSLPLCITFPRAFSALHHILKQLLWFEPTNVTL